MISVSRFFVIAVLALSLFRVFPTESHGLTLVGKNEEGAGVQQLANEDSGATSATLVERKNGERNRFRLAVEQHLSNEVSAKALSELLQGKDEGTGSHPPPDPKFAEDPSRTDGNTESAADTSDRRLKTNIAILTPTDSSMLEKLMRIVGVTYNYDTEKFPDKNFESCQQVGFIAQDVELEFPEIVRTDKDGYKSLMYYQFIPILTDAIRELNIMVIDLKESNAKLQEKVISLEQRLETSEAL